MSTRSAVIIGAGLTGLTTAFYLKKAGWEVTILERSARTGGSIQTHRENGFIFESGPNTGIITNTEVADLFVRLGPDFKFEPANEEAKRRLIWKGCRWYALPHCLKEGIRTPLFKWRDKFRILLEPFRTKGRNPDETLDELVRRRMGNSFLNYAIDPFILGVYAGDPAQLVTRYAFPKLYNLEQEYGSFIKGSIKKYKERKSPEQQKVTRQMFSVTGGLDNLVSTLTEQVGIENFVFNCRRITIYPKGDEYSISYAREGQTHQINNNVVITTTGANEVDSLLPFLNQKEKESINNLNYAKVIQVAIGFKKWRGLPLKAFGGLIPHKENRKILGILFPSAFLKGRAPEDGALLSVFLGGVRNPEILHLDDSIIKAMVMEELRCMMLVPSGDEPDLFKIFRHNHAIPQYEVTTGERLSTIAKIESRFPGLILAGNIRDGIGMADRIKQGTTIAQELIKG
ncbi:protoporphyrinogen oxidase [Alkalitalea saponilacus]|uniref:Coproporphyrinogen III oxidase n=1 Tax=Alkalitalea saponilacus TaxID=889453 RepID=A0A1T5HSF9_9BACT|nr:protoporphyrinogen oxidase [Alkalitalea saponilacus]ASB47708.1 protoporphyrinogen oxidase [Alkalitalea saponilacus]SKC23634.1 oxygen-dependent protoporphyrinogen oxidase [Alkalitalea saponilacus]